MVRTPSIDKSGMKRGSWSEEEDDKLRSYVERYGHPNWRQLPRYAGLMRCGKSCRLRWMNYLRPGLKKGKYSHEEEQLIIKLHNQLGNRWSTIAEKLPGRSDNDIKNHWHAHLKKRSKSNTNSSAIMMKQLIECSQSESQDDEHSNSKFAEHDSFSPIDSVQPVSSDVSSSSVLNGMDCWFEEDNHIFSSMEPLPDFFNFSWTKPIYNFQTEPFDHYWTEAMDNFWTEPFF